MDDFGSCFGVGFSGFEAAKIWTKADALLVAPQSPPLRGQVTKHVVKFDEAAGEMSITMIQQDKADTARKHELWGLLKMLQPNQSFQWFLVYIALFDFDLYPRVLNWRWSNSWCACSSGRVFNYVKQHFEVPQEKSCLKILQETFPAGSCWIAPQGA